MDPHPATPSAKQARPDEQIDTVETEVRLAFP